MLFDGKLSGHGFHRRDGPNTWHDAVLVKRQTCRLRFRRRLGLQTSGGLDHDAIHSDTAEPGELPARSRRFINVQA
jgi:hypothetical protein